MANILTITVENPDQILNAGHSGAGAVVQVQSAATSTGTYADVGTVAIVTGTTAYTFYHAGGDSTTWYRTRFETSVGTATSDWSAVFQVGGEAGGYLCSLYDVKQRLGIADSTTTNDEQLLSLIRSVTTEIERLTGRDFTGDRQDQVYTFDVAETDSVLWIDRGLQSVTTLELAPTTGGAYTATTSYYLRPKDREWVGEPYSRVELHNAWFREGYDTVRLTGKLGWSEVPPEVARIAESAVVAKWLSKGAEGPRAVIGESGRAIILRDVSPADWDTLMRFAVPVVA